MTPEHPDGEVPFPQNVSTESEGFVLIVLDGVGRENFLDSELIRQKLIGIGIFLRQSILKQDPLLLCHMY